MPTELYEPIRRGGSFEVTFVAPPEACWGDEPQRIDLNPMKVNGIEKCDDGTYRLKNDSEDSAMDQLNKELLCKRLQKEVGELNIEFIDKTDEMENAKAVRKMMEEWCSLVKDHVENTFSLFEVIEETSDATHTDLRLKKPISELNDDEKDMLRRIMTECFGVTDLKKFGL